MHHDPMAGSAPLACGAATPDADQLCTVVDLGWG